METLQRKMVFCEIDRYILVFQNNALEKDTVEAVRFFKYGILFSGGVFNVSITREHRHMKIKKS